MNCIALLFRIELLFAILLLRTNLSFSFYETSRYFQPRQIHLQSTKFISLGDLKSPEKVFIFGLGYVGCELAFALQKQGYNVAGTCTNVNKALELRELGINTFLFDELSAKRHHLETVGEILSSNFILSTIPPLGEGAEAIDIVLENHTDDLRKAAMSSNGLKWIGYLSSTGVYGECEGAWIDENREIRPDNSKTIARASSEFKWRQLYLRSGLPIHVFRLAGIYGNGRSALDTLRKTLDNNQESNVITADDSTFISRIHLDDIIQLLLASMRAPEPGAILNVADDLPSTRFDVLSYAGRLMGAVAKISPNKRLNSADFDILARGGSKRVDNTKMKRVLSNQGLSLLFPDYRSGLNHLWESYLKIKSSEIERDSPVSSKEKELSKVDSTSADFILMADLKKRLEDVESRVSSIEKDQKTILSFMKEISQAMKGQQSSS